MIRNIDGKIQFSGRLINQLRLNRHTSFFYTMFSDTEEKYLKLVFFDLNQTVAFVDIHHQDMYGAISKFTEIIYKQHKFNILASYSHQQMQKDTAHWFALIDISNKRKEFFSEILDQLKSASYFEIPEPVFNVFLIETNDSSVPEKIILKYGQNRKTKDGSSTSVYKAKKELIGQLLDKDGIAFYKKNPTLFKERHQLHAASSVDSLIKQIINEKTLANKIKNKNFFIKIFSLALTIIIFGSLYLFIPRIRETFNDYIHHAQSFIAVMAAMGLYFFIHKYLEKKVNEMLKQD